MKEVFSVRSCGAKLYGQIKVFTGGGGSGGGLQPPMIIGSYYAVGSPSQQLSPQNLGSVGAAEGCSTTFGTKDYEWILRCQ